MTITALMDNYCSARGLHGEHGLSLFIESEKTRILFDSGQDGVFLDNARALGVDLSRLSAVVLSHGHYDHAGGLPALYAALSEPLPALYAGKDFDSGRLARSASTALDIGLPSPWPPRTDAEIRIVDSLVRIARGIWILPAAPIESPPVVDPRLTRLSGGQEVPDEFQDELALVLEADAGIAVVTGCAHRGVLNILAAARRAFPDRPVQVVLGGFHLSTAREEDLARIASGLAEAKPDRLYCMHCTGPRGFAALSAALPGKVSYLACGARISI